MGWVREIPLPFRRPRVPLAPLPRGSERFGIRSWQQVRSSLSVAWPLARTGRGFQLGPSTLGFARPDLTLPAWLGWVPRDGLVPIYHLFDRTTGGRRYSYRVTRTTARDFRGGRLTYDDHDGIDFVCPPGTLVGAAAAGVVVAVRDRWLRGGLTVCVDHGHGLLTQYTHCSHTLRQPGDVVTRGEAIARSGVSGIDMTLSCPWVPPHLHVSVWLAGRPVDPFRSADDAARAGQWTVDNHPTAASAPPRSATRSSRLASELDLGESPIDDLALDRLCDACTDSEIRAELDRAASYRPGLAAIIEDVLHHERHALPERLHGARVRPEGTGASEQAAAIRLTLPLASQDYVGARIADTLWTRP